MMRMNTLIPPNCGRNRSGGRPSCGTSTISTSFAAVVKPRGVFRQRARAHPALPKSRNQPPMSALLEEQLGVRLIERIDAARLSNHGRRPGDVLPVRAKPWSTPQTPWMKSPCG